MFLLKNVYFFVMTTLESDTSLHDTRLIPSDHTHAPTPVQITLSKTTRRRKPKAMNDIGTMARVCSTVRVIGSECKQGDLILYDKLLTVRSAIRPCRVSCGEADAIDFTAVSTDTCNRLSSGQVLLDHAKTTCPCVVA